jgi:hypothetical protein
VSDLERLGKAMERASAELDLPSPNWADILGRARQLVAHRIRMAIVIGAVGAGLLLAGGLIARAAVTPGSKSPSVKPLPEPHPNPNPRPGPQPGPHPTPRLESPNLTLTLEEDTAVVENDSSVAAGPFQVIVSTEDAGVSNELPPFESEGIAAGETQRFSFRCSGGVVTATVALTGGAAESNQGDNTAIGKCLPNEEEEEEEETEGEETSTSETTTTEETAPG